MSTAISVIESTRGRLTEKRIRSTISSIAEQFGLDEDSAEDAFYEGATRVLDEEEAYRLGRYLGR